MFKDEPECRQGGGLSQRPGSQDTHGSHNGKFSCTVARPTTCLRRFQGFLGGYLSGFPRRLKRGHQRNERGRHQAEYNFPGVQGQAFHPEPINSVETVWLTP